MNILFNDIIQCSDAPWELKSPALSDVLSTNGEIEIKLDKPRKLNAVGLGNCDGNVVIKLYTKSDYFTETINPVENGLYMLPQILNDITLIKITAVKIGRFAAGYACNIPTAVMKEPSYKSTSEPRITLSGQVIPGRGGYNYKTLHLDSRYKITREIMAEIDAGYKYIGMGYPFFIDFEDEAYKLPFTKLYATETKQLSMTFQSGVRRFLYSRSFEFEERF